MAREPIAKASVSFVLWAKSINQIFLGLGNGEIRVLYDPKISREGIMRCVTKREKRMAFDDGNNVNVQPMIINPDEDWNVDKADPTKLREESLKDPKFTLKPDQPVQGSKGKGGRVPVNGTYSQFIM